MSKRVICDLAGQFSQCGECAHGRPHGMIETDSVCEPGWCRFAEAPCECMAANVPARPIAVEEQPPMVAIFDSKSGGLPENLPSMSEKLRHSEAKASTRPAVGHYQTGSIECIDALVEVLGSDGFVGFCRGNIIKYLWRLGRKGSTLDELVADVEKARNYCDFLLDALKTGRRCGG